MVKTETGKHNGEFTFQADCTFNCLDVDGEEFEKQFLGGKRYWIDDITNYPDGYSDIKFYDGTVLFQIKMNEIGYHLGRVPIIESEEIIPEEPSTET